MGDQGFFHRWIQSHRYALVDAVWRPELPAHWQQTALAPSFLGADTDRCPALLDVASLNESDQAIYMTQVQEQLLQRESTWCSLMLASDAGLDRLAQHLTARLPLQLPQTPAPKQFRYFDPGTFLQLPALLGEDGMAWLLGPVSSVLVPWAGEWKFVQKSKVSAGSFFLRAAHLQELSRMGATNRVAAQAEPATTQAEWLEGCRQIAGHVRRAQLTHGLMQQVDQIAFAQQALQHHPRFDEHAVLVDVFKTLRSAQPEDELDYIELTGRITPPDWARIARELNAAMPSNSATTASQPSIQPGNTE